MKLLVVHPRALVAGWGGDTPRLLQMARGLRQLGWEVELLRCKHPEDARFKAVMDAFPGRVVTAPFFGPFSSLLNRKGLRRAARLWWSLSNQAELSDYPELTANRFSKFVLRTSISRPDVVLGITTGHLESFASADRLSVHFHAPLVLEYRDPLPHPGCPPLACAQQSLLERCLSHASAIITTTQSLSASLALNHPVTTGKVHTVYSCYDDEAAAPAHLPAATDRLVLLHAGALHGGQRRNARSLVRAIAQAAQADSALRERVQLRLVGAAKGGIEAMELARELGVPWAVELRPQMSHQDCLAQMDSAHVLVVIKFDDAQYDLQVPGKTFQYLGRAKPILGIMRETEAAKILRRSGLGLVLDHSDIDGISAAILDLYRHRDALQSKFKPDWKYIRQFSLTEMTKNFHREFSSVAGTAPQEVNGASWRSQAPAQPLAHQSHSPSN